MAVTLPILRDVGVTRTSLAVFGPLAPPVAPAAALPLPGPPPAAPAAAPPPPALPAVPAWPPVAPPFADWSVEPSSPAEMAWPDPPRDAFTKALLGRRVPHACRTSARIGRKRSSFCLRRAVPSGRRRRPPIIPLPVTRCMARPTLG